MSLSDEELRTRFERLRESDRPSAPPFHAMWHRLDHQARRRSAGRPAPLAWLAAAVALVLALGIGLRAGLDRAPAGPGDSSAAPPEPISDLVRWVPLTASLLRAPGRELLAPPPILSSVLDHAASAPGSSQGVER